MILNTGRNHAYNDGAGNNYWNNNNDEYWILTSGSNVYSYPVCAKVWEWAAFSGFGPNSLPISIEPAGIMANINANAACSLAVGTDYYTFSRKFFVCFPSGVNTATGVLNLFFNGDDKVENIRVRQLFPPYLVETFPGTPGCNSNDVILNTTLSNNLVEGMYEIEALVLNRQLNFGSTSIMKFQLEGTISDLNGNAVFIDNNHFGKHDACANPVLQTFNMPTLSLAACISAPATSGQVNIGSFTPAAYTYKLYENGILINNNLTNSYFTGNVGSSYMVSATDNYGCTGTATINVEYPPELTLSPSPLCLPQGLAGIIIPSVNNGSPEFWYSSTPAGITMINIPPLGNVLAATAVGFYTVTVTDANGCTGTTALAVGNAFTLALTGINGTPPCMTLGTPIDLEATTTPSIPNMAYSFDGGPFTPNNLYNINALGTYSVTAMDPYGCSATATATVHENPAVSITTTGEPCNTLYTVLPAGLVSYAWAGNPSPQQINSNDNTAWPIYIYPDLPGPNTPQTYTVTATDIHGCTGTASTSWVQDEFCCDIYTYNGGGFSSQPAYNNNLASDILNAFGNPASNIVTANGALRLDGTIIIDEDLTLLGCYNVRLTGSTQIIVNPGITLTIDNSHLGANCNEMWKGIFVGADAHLIIKNNSVLEEMKDGVVSAFGGTLNCTNSFFRSNYYSMQIFNSPANFVSSGGCVITNNTFHDGGGYLLLPYPNQVRTGKCHTSY